MRFVVKRLPNEIRIKQRKMALTMAFWSKNGLAPLEDHKVLIYNRVRV